MNQLALVSVNIFLVYICVHWYVCQGARNDLIEVENAERDAQVKDVLTKVAMKYSISFSYQDFTNMPVLRSPIV